MSATDKWPGFVLTREGEEFVQQNANLFKYDLLYNPLRFESWQRLANFYDEVKYVAVFSFPMMNAVKL
jgi:calcineurin-binding protein cabin-1